MEKGAQSGHDFLEGGGRMGALMRAHDWTRSPLGDPAGWPDGLKSAVATCLASRFPMVVWWGRDLVMLYNDAWQPILGETKHPGGLGRPGAESWPETWAIVRQQFEEALRGNPSWSEDLLLASDRQGFLQECYFTYSHGPLRDASGAVVGVLSVVSETTARVLNERRLRVLCNLSAATLEAAAASPPLDDVCASLLSLLCSGNPDVPFAVHYLAAGNGRVRLAAAAGIDSAQFPRDVTAADTDPFGIAQALRDDHAVTMPATASTGPLPGGEWPEPTRQVMALPLGSSAGPDGRGVLVVGVNARLPLDETYVGFLRLVAVQLAGAVATLQGIEKDKSTAAAMDLLLKKERVARGDAERAARLKDEFLAIVSHELRTPLSAVIGWAQILSKDLLDTRKARVAVEVIERNARIQAQLISDLLDASRIISGNMQLNVAPLDIAGVVEAAIASVKPAADAKGVHIESALGAVERPIAGDARRLQQAMWNLLSNAVKFSQRGGVVTVTARDNGSCAAIRISDSGDGIDPQFLPHLFERFRQADASPSRAHGGLGLGLSIVKQLVEMHGGRVSASSDGRGRGATFVIEIPIAGAVAHTASARAGRGRTDEPHAPHLHGMKVLVVDDEPDALAMIRRILEDSHTDVTTAASSEVALEILDGNENFDLIVSDIGLPGRDGYALIAEIRTRGIRTPALALTAYARADDRRRAILSGYQAHVTKPIECGEFLAALDALAGKARRAPRMGASRSAP